MFADTEYSDYLKVSGLSKDFLVQGQALTVLSDINLNIRQGEFVSIVGNSGCGKSTLLRIIAGLEAEYRGEVDIKGQKLTKPGLDRGIVFQEHRLFPWLSVKENIAYGIKNLPKAETEELIASHIELVGLQGFENAYPHQLSGGMAQRASIARALVNRPEILLLDEPFGALDALTRIQMQAEVLRIREKEKSTMILVTHDVDEAIYLGDRVVVMSARPGTIKKIIPIELPRPRDRSSFEFMQLRRDILKEFFVEEKVVEDFAI